MSVNKEHKAWHSIPLGDVFKILETGPNGISSEEARRRLEKYGPNEIAREKRISPIIIFVRQFKSILMIILIIACVISLIIGEIIDSITILAILTACAFVGFFQEYRSEKAVEMLKKLAAPVASVIRDGKEVIIPSREVVPGDIVILRIGDKVPADLRLIEAVNLKIDEAPLTGESTPVEKTIEILPEETPLADRRNMCFSGTTVIYGRGKGVVVTTGMNTEFGKIAKMVQREEKQPTPLERRMEHVGKWLGILSLIVCGVVALLGLFRGHGILEMLIWGISLAIAAVPEALPAVVTGALAIGTYEMAKKNAIIRRLPAVETLGCTTVICSDKTGTMTKGEMTVRRVYVDRKIVEVSGIGFEPKGEFKRNGKRIEPLRENTLKLLLLASALCNDSKLIREENRWLISGDPTEGALKVLARKAGLTDDIVQEYPRVNEVPFTSERKRMTTVHASPDGKYYAFMKGAPEEVLKRCKWIMINGEVYEITEDIKKELLSINEDFAKNALRNLALAYKEVKEPMRFREDSENEFIFLGIVGMMDPPREEVKKAIELCKAAKINVIMITGDHKLTAEAIAKELGLLSSGDRVLTGVELDRLTDEELEKIVEEVKVYARVSPEHKTKIVRALKKHGHIVAMTGDGINDAPSLKIADIGISMGITGTEVTKEASDMILADDNFATIVDAVREGRRVFDNIKKYLTYLLQCNIAEILIMLVATVFAWPLPLTAVQILWVNLVTDGPPALALGVDPAEPDIMYRPPRKQREGVFTKEVKMYLVTVPIMITVILSLLFYHNLIEKGLIEARTRLFTSLILVELVIALTCRSLRYPIIKAGLLKSKALVIAVIVSFLMQILILYTPQLHLIFDITFPSLDDWLTAILSALVLFAGIELGKLVFGRKTRTKTFVRQ